jgi:hypothetical protein
LRPRISRIIGEQLSEVDGKLKRQCNEEQQNEGERMTKEACKRLTEEIRLSHSRKHAQWSPSMYLPIVIQSHFDIFQCSSSALNHMCGLGWVVQSLVRIHEHSTSQIMVKWSMRRHSGIRGVCLMYTRALKRAEYAGMRNGWSMVVGKKGRALFITGTADVNGKHWQQYTYGLRDYYAFSLCPLILVAIIDHLCEIL